MRKSAHRTDGRICCQRLCCFARLDSSSSVHPQGCWIPEHAISGGFITGGAVGISNPTQRRISYNIESAAYCYFIVKNYNFVVLTDLQKNLQ